MGKDMFKLGLNLLIISAVAALLLALTNSVTASTIAQRNEQANAEARKLVLESAQDFEEVKDAKTDNSKGVKVSEIYEAKDASGNTEGFSFSDGEIDIEAQRSKTYKLEGLKVLTKEEFDKNTEKLKETIILNGVQSFEAGDDKVKDDTLEDYSLYGVIYDSERELWRYEDKDIYIFYDQDGYKLIQGDVNIKNSVSLKVERNQDGKIEKLVKLNENEVASYTKEIIQ